MISPFSEKVRGRVPRVPHLIAPMAGCPNAVLGHVRDNRRAMGLINVAHFILETVQIMTLDSLVAPFAAALRYPEPH